MSPIATPETGALIGTPASINASVDPQTEPIEVEPLDDKASDTTRMVYGKDSAAGMTGSSARSANAPCPTSRLLWPRRGFTSPVEYGGEVLRLLLRLSFVRAWLFRSRALAHMA